jgi:hypothetical protein
MNRCVSATNGVIEHIFLSQSGFEILFDSTQSALFKKLIDCNQLLSNDNLPSRDFPKRGIRQNHTIVWNLEVGQNVEPKE